MEILRGIERRRRWSVEEKLAIVAEAARSEVSVSAVARRHDLNPNQVFKWRRQARRGELSPDRTALAPAFVPVAVCDEVSAAPETVAAATAEAGAGRFEVRLCNGRTAWFSETIRGERLRALLHVLEDR